MTTGHGQRGGSAIEILDHLQRMEGMEELPVDDL
jgi:hypothetical protein